VNGLGRRAIDMRTSLGKALSQWRGDLVADLGGRDAISTQQAAIVDLAVKTKLILDSIDAWLLQQPTLINKRNRSVLPVVRERQQLADALARYMAQLGLERRSRPVKDLRSYVAERYGQEGAPTTREQAVRERNEEPR
jgi:chorismate mutase